MKPFDYTEWSYSNYIADKSVLIVGGSSGAEGWIPSVPEYDVIVRINNHVLNQGGSCHVLYHSSVPSITPYLVNKIHPAEFVFLNLVDDAFDCGRSSEPLYLDFLSELREESPRTDVGFFAQGEWMDKNPYGQQYEWLNDLHKKYQAKLFTGLVALAHLMRFSPASISVVGMDMYIGQTGGKIVPKIESHELANNLIFLRDARKDPRVIFSDQLTEALKLYGII